MDKATLKKLRKEFDNSADIKRIEEMLGVKIELGNGTFGNNNATFKLKVSDVEEDGTVITKEASDFMELAQFYGLDPNDLGASFTFNGDVFTIVGLKTRFRKNRVLAEKNGRTYRFSEEVVKLLLEKSKA